MRPWAEFLATLERWGIATVVDVRRFPVSRRHPQFARAAMAPALASAGIHYVHLGESLGGYVPGGYPAYMETVAFREGLAALERVAAEAPATILCAEAVPWKCHRRFIAAAMEQRGWSVVHILDAQRALPGLGPPPEAGPPGSG